MKKSNLLLASMMTTSLFMGSVQAADALTAAQEAAVKSVVKELLQENPELVIDAIQAWRDKQTALEAAQLKQSIADLQKDVANTTSPYWGNAKADTVIVEFSDYNCPYCKRVFPAVHDLVDMDGDIKVVMKELPVLGPASEYAGKAAIAAHMQGKYMAFHTGMMEQGSRLSVDGVLEVAKESGLDVDKLKADMQSATVSKELAANRQLAEQLGITGTPAFVIGDELVPGAIDAVRLSQLVQKSRKK